MFLIPFSALFGWLPPRETRSHRAFFSCPAGVLPVESKTVISELASAHMNAAIAERDPPEPQPAPELIAASSNGNLLRFLQDLALGRGWEFRGFLSGEDTIDSLAGLSPRLLVLDVFLDGKGGFDLRGQIRLKSEYQLAPVMLVAPGCLDAAELSERLEISQARFDVKPVDEVQLAEEIAMLMADDPVHALQRELFRFGTFLQTSGEVCHAINQPLTSLICNLELAMHALEDESLKQRLKITHESALKIMRIVQRFQHSKRSAERGRDLPVYLLSRAPNCQPAS